MIMGRTATEDKIVMDLEYTNQSKALDYIQNNVHRWKDGGLGGI